MKKKFEKSSIKICFIDDEDIMAKSVGWNSEDWDGILDASSFYGGKSE